MRKIKKGDRVVVLAGKDKGKQGTVLEIANNDRILVDGVNHVKKHQKPNPTLSRAGGIVEKALPVHVSNVALLNPATNKADRVGFRLLADGRKVRYFKSTNEVVDA
ncbi:50S ribosomal protein L24 [Methylococcus sp. EFPC2]|uniref:50S ribosomal protein L24 n=1 Tax=Methylococcus sp. EFPC2 TaxID=2812648 RepID=UPI001967FD76|nr:50S ribosomal protein L24 [Methylococcus sp. EFPC2]QSA95953.1 50S ribosomal protein L24 [Methylococcus sp. EFPC2]